MSWFQERWERRLLEMRFSGESAPVSRVPDEPKAPRPPRSPAQSAAKSPPRSPAKSSAKKPASRAVGRRAKAQEILPGPRRSLPGELAGRLVDRWCTASVTAGWATPGFWWNVEVDAVVEAVLDDGDHVPPCSHLAARRARDGVSLAETLDDIAALFRAARLGPPPFETVRAMSLAWSEASAEHVEANGCLDRRSGLATGAHVRARLFELYREAAWAGHSLSETHTLVFVELAQPEDVNPDIWNDSLRMTDVAECLRAVFDAGQTIGLAGPGRAVALVSRSTEVPRDVECLRRLLNDWHRFAAGGPSPRIWVEPLPQAPEAAGRLLNEIAC